MTGLLILFLSSIKSKSRHGLMRLQIFYLHLNIIIIIDFDININLNLKKSDILCC